MYAIKLLKITCISHLLENIYLSKFKNFYLPILPDWHTKVTREKGHLFISKYLSKVNQITYSKLLSRFQGFIRKILISFKCKSLLRNWVIKARRLNRKWSVFLRFFSMKDFHEKKVKSSFRIKNLCLGQPKVNSYSLRSLVSSGDC